MNHYKIKVKKFVCLFILAFFLWEQFQVPIAEASKKSNFTVKQSENVSNVMVADIDNSQILNSKTSSNNKVVNYSTNTESVMSVGSGKGQIPRIKENPEYIKVISSLSSFSKATQKEKDIISKQLGIDFNQLIKAEENGFSMIGDAILAAKITINTKLSFPDIKKELFKFKDLESFYTSSKEYADIIKRWNFSANTVNCIRNYFLNGYDIFKLENAGVIAETFNVNLQDIFSLKQDESMMDTLRKEYSLKEAEKIYSFATENNVSLRWLMDYTKNKKMKWIDFEKKARSKYDNNSKTLSQNTTTATNSVSTITASTLTQAEESSYKAPFTYEEYKDDKVEMNTGSLIVENTDVSLPGRNGLDFTLKSRYNSEKNVWGEEEYFNDPHTETFYWVQRQYDRFIYNTSTKTYSLVDEDLPDGNEFEACRGEYERLGEIYNGPIKRYCDSGEYRYIWKLKLISQYSKTVGYSLQNYYTPTYYQQDSPLGYGWNFTFDSIEIVNSDSYYNNDLKKDAYFLKKSVGKFLHLENGQVYEIDSNLKLVGYKLDDIWLEQNTSYTNGQGVSSSYVLKYKNGLKEYFASDGRLLAKVDRFNNTIQYQHTLIRNHPVVTKIIDTLGREVTINYDFDNLQVVVTAPGNKQVIYKLSKDNGVQLCDPNTGKLYYTYSYYVVSRKDMEKRVNLYGYNYSMHLQIYAFKQTRIGLSGINVLSKITYPTGSYVQYEYTDERRYVPNGYETYPVARKRVMVDTKGNNTFNREYVYNVNYTRYPYETSDKTRPEINYPETYSFINLERNNTENSNEYRFDYENQLIAQERYTSNVYYNGTDQYVDTVNKNIRFESTEFKYDTTYKQLIQKKTKKYTIPVSAYNTVQDLNKYLLGIEDYEYDQYGDLIKYWNQDAARDSNGNLTTTGNPDIKYTYDTANYLLLTKKEYKKNADTSITEDYTLTSDKKNISEISIKENGIPVSKTGFGYDSWNNINSEKRYLKDGGFVNYIETNYGYQDNVPSRNSSYSFNGAYLTNKYTPEKKNADGDSNRIIEENYKYDDYGNKVEYDEPNGSPTYYQYDGLGRTTQKTNADNTKATYSYDNVKNELIVTDENGSQIKYVYDGFGNLLSQQDVNTGGNLKSYTYNTDLKLDTEKDNTSAQNCYTINYQYNYDGRIKTKITKDKSGTIVSQEEYLYEDACDLNGDNTADCSKITKSIIGDANSPSIVTTQYVDNKGHLIREGRIHNGIEYFNTYQYDYLGNKTQEKISRAYDEPSLFQNCSYTAKYDYDFAGRVIKETDVNGKYTTKEYDVFGNVTKATDFKANTLTGGAVYSTINEYDNLGRLIIETIPFEQGTSGNISYTIKKHYYDGNGNVISEWVTSNKPGEADKYNITGYEYNNRNMLTKVTTYKNYKEPNDISTDKYTAENYTQYYYDAAGNKIRMYTGLSKALTISGLDSVTANGDSEYSVTKYEYDRFGKMTKMTDPLNKEESYTYDLNGNLIEKKDRNGNVISMTYDGLGRLLTSTVVTPDGSGNKSLTYTYTLTGQRLSSTAGTSSTAYTYDDLGRLTTETSGTITKEYTYDAADNRKSLIIKQNGTVKTSTTYTYDNKNRLETVSEGGVLKATYTYDDNGNRQSLTYANGNSTVYDYNLANKLKTLTNYKGTTILSKYDYTYYLDGNQACKTDLAGKTTSYTYDGLGRLTSESPSGESAVSYSYDDYNNRAVMTASGGAITTYGYDKNNRLQSEVKTMDGTTEITYYSYDDNGNQIYKSTGTLKPVNAADVESISISVSGESPDNSNVTISRYDGFNQLINSTVGDKNVSYDYNADGLRISKTVNGAVTQHIWDGDQIALELDGSGNVTNKYVRGINLIYAEASGAVKYYLFNGHGDVVQLTGNIGDVSKSYDYDAFGNEKNPDAADTNVFRYCGEYFDKETGTIYLRARYYDPEVGRFITEDSYWGESNDPLSLNLYTYCEGDPVNFFDPDGHAVALGGLQAYASSLKKELSSCIKKIDSLLSKLSKMDKDDPAYKSTLSALNSTFDDYERVNNKLRAHYKASKFAFTVVVSAVAKSIINRLGSLFGKKATPAVKTTGTVWDSIKGTQGVYAGTPIPKSFELSMIGRKFWVHPNATEHMFEYVTRNLSFGVNISSQFILDSFKSAVSSAMDQGIKYDKMMKIGNWELIFSKPRAEGQLPVIKHALYVP